MRETEGHGGTHTHTAEREREREERRGSSLLFIDSTSDTSHVPMAPYLPVPCPSGTSLPAFTQVPSPDSQGPSASERQYEVDVPASLRTSPHFPTHPNTPSSAPPSPCSSALFLGANTASTPSVLHIEASGTAKRSLPNAPTRSPLHIPRR